MSKKLVFLGILLTPLCMCFVGLITFSPGELGFVLSLSHASEVDVKKQDKSAESIGSKTSQQNPLTRYPINKLKDTHQSEVIEIIFGTLISLIGLFCIIIAVICDRIKKPFSSKMITLQLLLVKLGDAFY